jgi:hypothetical protein
LPDPVAFQRGYYTLSPKKPEFSVNSRENDKIAKKSVISPAFAGTELWFINTVRLILALYG